MDFMTAVRTCLNKYADFNGRARRSEFWFFYLAVILVGIVAAIIDGILGLRLFANQGVLGTIVTLGTIVPTLAAGSRRLHDTGRSGWWQLLLLIPCIGFIVLIVFWATDSAPGTNQHGPNPKGVGGFDQGMNPPTGPDYGAGYDPSGPNYGQ